MLRSRLSTDDGSASLEFLGLGMLLLVPLVYLVVAVATIQGAAFAVEGAARQAARVFVQAPDAGSADASATRAVTFALADHDVTVPAHIVVRCSDDPCLTRQGYVRVTVSVSVPLPLVPPVLGGDFPLTVPLRASATEQVSRFWGAQ